MLERIHIENYKCLVDFDLRLKDTTLLLGANGTGKTAILDVVYGLRKLLAGEVKLTDPVAFPSSTLTRWQIHQHQEFGLQARVGDESFHYLLRIEHAADMDDARVARETLRGEDRTVLFDCEMGEVRLFRDDGSAGPVFRTDWSESALARVVPQPANTRLTSFLNAIRDTVVCTIRPHGIHTEAARGNPRLGRYADNFVGWYRGAVLEHPGTAHSHVEALRAVIEGLDGLRLRQVGADTRELRLRFVNPGGRVRGNKHYELRLDELSDGQRALVVLYGLLHLGQDGGGIWLFLDEPDNYVALSEIQPWLMALAELCEDSPSQAVLCSHHPELIDYLGPDHGQVLRRNTSGAITAQPISKETSGGLKLSELVARGWDS